MAKQDNFNNTFVLLLLVISISSGEFRISQETPTPDGVAPTLQKNFAKNCMKMEQRIARD